MAEPEPIGLPEFREIIDRLEELKRGAPKYPQPVPLIDPTANVLSLVQAATKRLDDLRALDSRRLDELRIMQAGHDREMVTVRSEAERILSQAESNRINAVSLAESRRIDALLAAATQAVALASEKAASTASTLATQVSASAEALRAQVAATAATTTLLVTQLRENLESRLSKVEQNQYAGGGASIQRMEGQQRNQWVIGLLAVIIVGLLAAAAAFWAMPGHKP
jgi:hypothetical protein